MTVQPWWARFVLRSLLASVVAVAAVSYRVANRAGRAPGRVRESVRFAVKRIQRTMHVIWYESKQWLAKHLRREKKRSLKLGRRVGSRVKRILMLHVWHSRS